MNSQGRMSSVLTDAFAPGQGPGIAKPDERTLRTLVLRADGFIDKPLRSISMTTGQAYLSVSSHRCWNRSIALRNPAAVGQAG